MDFIRCKLKVGGVLYISYNTLPGWGAFAPMRHLMTEHAEVIGAKGLGILSRIDDAVEFADKLLDTNPLFAKANPAVSERVKKLKDQNRHYLAHEYFNRDWHPMHFATMREWLETAKLNFACSANYLDGIDRINLTQDQQAFLKEIPDEMFRESVRDFMVNQQFRKDYWVKGPRSLSALEQAEAIRSQRVILTGYWPDVSLKVNGSLGEATMSDKVYGPILDLLADHEVKTLAQLERELQPKGINLPQIIEVVLVLSAIGKLASVQDEAVISRARAYTDKLNASICARARSSDDIAYLASPVTGGGIHVSRFHQLFLRALGPGLEQTPDWAAAAWEILSAQNQRILKDGKTLETPEDNIAELKLQAEAFAKKQLPALRALQIA